jgi:hypothetical protein
MSGAAPAGPGEDPADAPTVESAAPPAKLSRARRIWLWIILGLATLLTILAIFSIWADRQLLNPTNWSNTSTELLQKPTVRSAISAYLVDQLYANVDVPKQLESGLPKELKPLSGPVSGALHNLAEEGAEKALESPRLQDVWRRANHAADETLVRIVDGGGPRVQIEGGTVSLNLRQIVAELAHRLGLPESVADKLPASVANLKVVTSEDLGLVRNMAKALHALAVWLTIIVVALFALAIYIAPGARRRTLGWCGWSLVLSGVVVIIGRKIGQGQLVGAVTNDASIQPAASDSYEVATSLLVQVASASIIIGIPVILSAWFAGPQRWAVAGRRFLAPHFAARPPLAYLLTAGLLAILFLWGPIPATRNPLTMLLFTVLSFLGAHLLRRQILEEFPGAEPISIRAALGERARAVSERVGRLRRSSTGQGGGGDSKVAELERLAALHERHALDDEEYAEAKKAVLAG